MTPLTLAAGMFLAPALAAAGAAAIAVPIAIHLLTRMRRKQVPWAAMKFLMEAFRKQRRRLQLEQLLLLLIRCLILIVLGLALAGPAAIGLARHLGAPIGGKVICIVIDDALSTQTKADGQNARFEDLRKLALKIVDGLGPGDQVALFTVARPHTPVIANPTPDLSRVRKAIEALTPQSSHSDWGSAMSDVAKTLTDQKAGRDRAAVFVVSDFSRGSLDPGRPIQAMVTGDGGGAGGNTTLGQAAKLFFVRPMPASPNLQIEAIRPRRAMVLAPPAGTVVIPLELSLRRFGGDSSAGLSGIEVTITGEGEANPVNTTVKREFRWAEGQSQIGLTMEVALPPGAARTAEGGSGTTLTVTAHVERAGMNDTLAADDSRQTIVELRSKLAIALIDESAAPSLTGSDLSPHDWAALALQAGAPRGANQGPIQLLDRAAAAVDDAALKGADAAVVLRPDLLSRDGWGALSRLAKRGGLVWIFAPPVETSAVWTTALKEHLGFVGQVGIEPRTQKPDAGPTSAPASSPAAGTDATESEGWRLVTDAPTPEPLKLLSADWASLLRPLRIYRRLELSNPGGAEANWLSIAGLPADKPADVLTTWATGEGRVVFVATALDATWSNLPTKPVFVPLLHETIRAVLGSLPRDAKLGALVAGDDTLLSAKWDGAQRLNRIVAGGKTTDSDNGVSLRRTDNGLETVSPFVAPGVYVPSPSIAGLRVAVNVDSSAGDTTALDEAAVSAWVSTAAATNEWAWINTDAPAAALTSEEIVGNLGWPLLWTTLALLIAETILARKFSHGELPGGPGTAKGVSLGTMWRKVRGGAA